MLFWALYQWENEILDDKLNNMQKNLMEGISLKHFLLSSVL